MKDRLHKATLKVNGFEFSLGRQLLERLRTNDARRYPLYGGVRLSVFTNQGTLHVQTAPGFVFDGRSGPKIVDWYAPNLGNIYEILCWFTHDCKPDSEACARHLDEYEEPKGAWCGDVWKAFVKLRATLPFAIYTWNHGWGCGIIDTKFIATENEKSLPDDVENLTYKDFVNHPEWMAFRDEPLDIDLQQIPEIGL